MKTIYYFPIEEQAVIYNFTGYILNNKNQINEFIFILDCNRSIKNGNNIGLIRQLMFYFIKNLLMNSYFNIIKFGTKYFCLFNQSTVFYNQINANLGGTEFVSILFGNIY